MALLILALLQRIFLMSSLMLLLVWLIFFMVLIKLLPILGTISGKTVKLMVLALICLGNKDRKSGSAGMPRPISYAVFCFKKKIIARVQWSLSTMRVDKHIPSCYPVIYYYLFLSLCLIVSNFR